MPKKIGGAPTSKKKIEAALRSPERRKFFELFYSESGQEHLDGLYDHAKELFDLHLQSGLGEVKVTEFSEEQLPESFFDSWGQFVREKSAAKRVRK